MQRAFVWPSASIKAAISGAITIFLASLLHRCAGRAFSQSPPLKASYQPCTEVSRSLGFPAKCVVFEDVLSDLADGEAPTFAESSGCGALEVHDNLTGSSISEFRSACLREAQVFWELVEDEAGTSLQGNSNLVGLCSKPSCFAPAALGKRWRARRASFFAGLEPLLLWVQTLHLATISAGSSVRKGYRRSPAVPPHNVIECQAWLEDVFLEEDFPWPSPMECAPGATVYPISFGIPLEDIVECVPKKDQDWAFLIPGKHSTYIFPMSYQGEVEYKRMYRRAQYADCPRKSGWESMRLYEILAAGTVPYIANLSDTGPGKLAFLNKRLVSQLMSLPGLSRENLKIDMSIYDKERYNELAARLLWYTRERLSTVALARYVLRTFDRPNLGKVLFVGHCGHGDFQCHLMLHGLRSLLGASLVDIPFLWYMYHPEEAPPMMEVIKKIPCPSYLCTTVTGSHHTPVIARQGQLTPLYGGGFSYAFRMEENAEVNRSRIIERVKAHEFDVLIFGNIEELSIPPRPPKLAPDQGSKLVRKLWILALERYAKEDIVVIDGGDPPQPNQPEFWPEVLSLAQRTTYFMREIPDSCSR